METGTRGVVEVYCDGEIWIGAMTDAVTAHASDFVGRTAVRTELDSFRASFPSALVYCIHDLRLCESVLHGVTQWLRL